MWSGRSLLNWRPTVVKQHYQQLQSLFEEAWAARTYVVRDGICGRFPSEQVSPAMPVLSLSPFRLLLSLILSQLVIVVMTKSTELKTKISHTHFLILSRPFSHAHSLILSRPFSHAHSLILSRLIPLLDHVSLHTHTHILTYTHYHLYVLL